MYFDIVTWSIWVIGFVILIIWIMVPVKEFKNLLKKKQIQFRKDEEK